MHPVFFQNIQNGFAFELPDLMEHDVPTADEFGKLGAVFGRAQPLIDFTDGFDAVDVVSVVFRQYIGRCFCLAQVVQ